MMIISEINKVRDVRFTVQTHAGAFHLVFEGEKLHSYATFAEAHNDRVRAADALRNFEGD